MVGLNAEVDDSKNEQINISMSSLHITGVLYIAHNSDTIHTLLFYLIHFFLPSLGVYCCFKHSQ